VTRPLQKLATHRPALVVVGVSISRLTKSTIEPGNSTYELDQTDARDSSTIFARLYQRHFLHYTKCRLIQLTDWHFLDYCQRHCIDLSTVTYSTIQVPLYRLTQRTYSTIPAPLSRLSHRHFPRYTAATSRLSVAMPLIPVTDAHGSTDYCFRRCHKCRFLCPPIDQWHLSCHLLDASESLPSHQSDFHRGRYIHRHDLSYPRYHWSFHVIAPMGPTLMQPHITTLTSNSDLALRIRIS